VLEQHLGSLIFSPGLDPGLSSIHLDKVTEIKTKKNFLYA